MVINPRHRNSHNRKKKPSHSCREEPTYRSEIDGVASPTSKSSSSTLQNNASLKSRPKSASKPAACAKAPSSPVEALLSPEVSCKSPIPGLNLEMATLILRAIKTRRKYFSKSTSKNCDEAVDEEKQQLAESLKNKADDATNAFLNELRQNVEISRSAATRQSSSLRPTRNNSFSNSVPHCLQFLLETFSNYGNSFHLRRSALFIFRNILERSSHGREYLASGRRLLEFVSVLEEVDKEEGDEDGLQLEEETAASAESLYKSMSPKTIFLQEAVDTIHYLASKYGNFYPKYIVASRLLGDVSVATNLFDVQHFDIQNGKSGRQRNMQLLRKERDIALEHGPKLCTIVERMIKRADGYFRVLVPRFGGLVGELQESNDIKTGNEKDGQYQSLNRKSGQNPNLSLIATENEKKHSGFEEKSNLINSTYLKYDDGSVIDTKPPTKQQNNYHDANTSDDGANNDDFENDSINWEDGDTGISDDEHFSNSIHDEHNPPFFDEPRVSNTSVGDTDTEHHAAVAQTLAIMEQSGALLDGEIPIYLGAKMSMASTNDDGLSTPISEDNLTTKARAQLLDLIETLSTKRLRRLNRCIHALSHADGMEERVVTDPAATFSNASLAEPSAGPRSLVLLSKEKRSVRGPLLQHMIKIRKEVDGILQIAARIGISIQENDIKKVINHDDGLGQKGATHNVSVSSRKRPQDETWGEDVNSNNRQKRKRPGISRIRVIYHNK